MLQKVENSSAPGRRGVFFINRNFGLLWGGKAVSVTGDYVFQTMLVLWMATVLARGQSWAPLAVSGILLASSIPTFLVGPLAGVFADRWEKRRIMMRMDIVRAVLVLLLIILVAGIPSLPFLAAGRFPILWQLGVLYSIVFLISICDQFFNPANMALIAHIVEQPDRTRASGLSQITGNLAIVIGPSLGALLFFSVGMQWALLFDAFSFVVSFFAIKAMRVAPFAKPDGQMPHNSFLHEFLEGLRFYASNRVLMTILVTGVIVLLGAGAFNALNIFFVTQNLHAAYSIYGVLVSIAGLGAIAGAVFATVFAQQLGVVRVFWVSVLAVGVVVVLFARMTSVIPALVLAFLIGFANTPISVAMMPLLLSATPQKFIGRVTAVLSPMMSAASTLSVMLAGYLASTVLRSFHVTVWGIAFGSVDTIFTCAGILAVLAGFYAMLSLRGVRLEDRNGKPAHKTPTAPLLSTAVVGEDK